MGADHTCMRCDSADEARRELHWVGNTVAFTRLADPRICDLGSARTRLKFTRLYRLGHH